MALTWRLSATAAVLLLLLLLLVRGSCSETDSSASGSSSGSGASGALFAYSVIVEFEETEYFVNETDGSVMFRIVKRTPTTAVVPALSLRLWGDWLWHKVIREVSVLFSSVDGTAVAGGDYSATIGIKVMFASDETVKTVSVPIVNDGVFENAEEFGAMLSVEAGTTGVEIGPNDTANAEITDDDGVTVQFFPTAYTVTEGGDTGLILVLVGETAVNITIDLATMNDTAQPLDYGINITQVTFQPGENKIRIPVQIIIDTVAEGTEQFFAVLTNPWPSAGATLGDDVATVVITDPTNVSVGFEQTQYSVNEADGVVTFRIVKRTPTTREVSVLFSTVDGTAVAGGDYSATTGIEVVFASDETMKTVNYGSARASGDYEAIEAVTVKENITISIPITSDSVAETLEAFTAALTTEQELVLVQDGMATITIGDDDAVEVNFSEVEYTVGEGTGTVTVCLELNTTASEHISVDIHAQESGDAVNGEDFTAADRRVTFQPNETRQCTEFNIIENMVEEQTESFSLSYEILASNITVIAGSANSSSVIITDDDIAVFDQDGTHRPLSGGAIAVIVIVLVIAAAVVIAVMVVAGVVHVMT